MSAVARFFTLWSTALIVALMAACGEDVELGRAVPAQKPAPGLTPADAGISDAVLPTDSPCTGKVCGDVCTPGGVVIHSEFRCNAGGECVDEASVSCDGG